MSDPEVKNEIPDIDVGCDEALKGLNAIREKIDALFQEQKPLTAEQYAWLCNLVYVTSEDIWRIRTMAEDHHCNVNPWPDPDEVLRQVRLAESGLVVLQGGAAE